MNLADQFISFRYSSRTDGKAVSETTLGNLLGRNRKFVRQVERGEITTLPPSARKLFQGLIEAL